MAEINPVLSKELRLRFRTAKTAWLIALYLFVIGSFVLGFMYLNWRHNPEYFQPDLNQELFAVLSVAQLVLLAFVTPGLTAGAISGERERQTLDVLLTTRLSAGQIVWSKLASSSAFTTLLVIATLPLYSIVFIYGGISPWQVLGVFGFYLVTMFLFGCIGMACSTFFKKTGVSTVAAYGIAFVLSAGTGFLAVFLNELDRFYHNEMWPTTGWPHGFVSGVIQFLQDINPVFVLMKILGVDGIETGVSFGLPYWGDYAVFYLVAGIILLCWSARMLSPRKRIYTD